MVVPGPVLDAFEAPGARAEPWGSGHIHRTFRVRCARRSLLLQCVNGRVFPDPRAVTEVVARVTDHLRRKARARGDTDVDRRVLRLVATRNGDVGYGHEDGTFWRAYAFLDDVRTYDRIPDATTARRAAFAFGRFLCDLEDLPGPRLPETLPGFHDLAARFDAFEATAARDRVGRAAAVEAEMTFVQARRSLAALPPGLTERVTHNDTKLDNVLFDRRSDEALCVIDLDTVMPGLALHDFGDLVRTMASTAAEDASDAARVRADPVLFGALADGFLAAAGPHLTSEEIEHLELGGRRMTLMVGLRFLTDHIDGDRYFRVDRPGHNLVRARAQFALLRSLERREPAHRRLVRAAADRRG